MGNPLTSSHAGVQKALYVLEVLKGLPAGDVIYQQVEQILSDLQENQAQVERTYHVIAHALLDAYLKHLNPATPLYIQASILQRRLQPPIMMSDLNAMRTQVDLYADHILAMKDLDPKKVQDSLSILLESVDITPETEAKEDLEKTQTMEIPQSVEVTPSNETTQFMKMPPIADTALSPAAAALTPSMPAVGVNNQLTEDAEELANKAMMIDEGLQNSISQNQEIGVVLDLLSSELVEMEQKEGIEPLRARMKELVYKLKTSQGDMVGQLQTTIDYLNSTVGDRDKLDQELRRVRRLSMTDELTGLPNRRAFMDRLEKEIGRVKRHHEPLSLILLDLDYFKNVNDTYGHAVGDQVLKAYANEVFSLFRQYDMVARYGGEEFAVLSPNTDMDGAKCALSKAMDRVKNLRCEINGESILVPSFSAGVAIYREGEHVESFLQRADQALYQAKSHGRNRIEVAVN